jgi:hypothetical protein
MSASNNYNNKENMLKNTRVIFLNWENFCMDLEHIHKIKHNKYNVMSDVTVFL